MKNILKLLSYEYLKTSGIFLGISLLVLTLDKYLLHVGEYFPWFLIILVGFVLVIRGPNRFWEKNLRWAMTLPLKRTTLIGINYICTFWGSFLFCGLIMLLVLLFHYSDAISFFKLEYKKILGFIFLAYFFFMHPLAFIIPSPRERNQMEYLAGTLWAIFALIVFLVIKFELWIFSPLFMMTLLWLSAIFISLHTSLRRIAVTQKTMLKALATILCLSLLPSLTYYLYSYKISTTENTVKQANAFIHWGKFLPRPNDEKVSAILSLSEKGIYWSDEWRKTLLQMLYNKELIDLDQDRFFNLAQALKDQPKKHTLSLISDLIDHRTLHYEDIALLAQKGYTFSDRDLILTPLSPFDFSKLLELKGERLLNALSFHLLFWPSLEKAKLLGRRHDAFLGGAAILNFNEVTGEDFTEKNFEKEFKNWKPRLRFNNFKCDSYDLMVSKINTVKGQKEFDFCARKMILKQEDITLKNASRFIYSYDFDYRFLQRIWLKDL